MMKGTRAQAAQVRKGAASARGECARGGALAALACAALLLAAWALVGCATQVKIDDTSPRVADVQLAATSQMTEASQAVTIRVAFDQPIAADGDVAGDFTLQLNGKEPDASTVKVEARASADAVTFTLSPAAGAAQGAGAGQFFALYQAQFSLASARDDGALPHITGASGSSAVLDGAIAGTLPSGLAIEVVDSRAGSAADALPAQTTVRVTSPAQARVITWFSPDGGATKLLKHNHTFTSMTAEDAAADLAKVVNGAQGLGITAQAVGDTLTLTATSAVDGQVIDPVIVQGVGVAGGAYDGSTGTGA